MLPVKHYLTKEGWKADYHQTCAEMRRINHLLNIAYWDMYYTVGYSSISGLGNGLGNMQQGTSFAEGFGEGYVHNFPLGIAINVIYPIVFQQLCALNKYRVYANLFTVAANVGFLAWHCVMGTHNPIQTMIPNTIVGLVMVNRHVSETQKNLEEKIGT